MIKTRKNNAAIPLCITETVFSKIISKYPDVSRAMGLQ